MVKENKMINAAWFAKLASDELFDTLYFGGFHFEKAKLVERGVKTYQYTTPQFVLKISGRKITIGNNSFSRTSDAKFFIQKNFMQ